MLIREFADAKDKDIMAQSSILSTKLREFDNETSILKVWVRIRNTYSALITGFKAGGKLLLKVNERAKPSWWYSVSFKAFEKWEDDQIYLRRATKEKFTHFKRWQKC